MILYQLLTLFIMRLCDMMI